MDRVSDTNSVRLSVIDQVRGLAIIGVVIFHLVWDLEFTTLVTPGLAFHPLWIAFGWSLAGTFMFLVGVSLVLANREVVNWKKAGKRVFVIAFCALLITIATYFAFPSAFVFYGILHAIAVASALGLLLVHFSPSVLLGLATLILFAPVFFSDPAFDTRWLAWVGFSQSPPVSNDLVPVFPWFGITLVGIALSRLALANNLNERLSATSPQNGAGKLLNFCGQHSLVIYLLHQPLLLGLLIPLSNWLKG